MERRYPHLFSPCEIRGVPFKNRLVAAPLGAWVFSPSNYVFDYAISMFEQKAIGGAAAVTVGNTEVNAEEDDTDGFGLYFNLRKREGTAALSEFAAAIKQHRAHVSLQLNYGGSFGPSEVIIPPGSGNREMAFHPMTEEKILQTIGQYADAARKLKLCGFDMCMIHGAHGWLPMQFLSADFNKRTDNFGGSLENRMRFPLMLIDAVRQAVGTDMLIEYRISARDPDVEPEAFEECVAFVKAIEGKVDIIHVSSGWLGKGGFRHMFPTYLDPRGLNVRLASALKKRVDIPVAVVGNITEPAMAEEIIAGGHADLVAMCRGLIADPEWPNKARRGREAEIRPCIGCFNCLDVMHERHYLGCDVNPRAGREHRIGEVTPARTTKRVAVVGGGPAGMQAAITAAERGHRVILYEKTEVLGGLLKVADNDPLKRLIRKYKEYLISQVSLHGIDVRLETEATPEVVEESTPDVVIVATGSEHIIPDIPGVGRAEVMTAVAAHRPGARLGERVVIVGGNLVGCETALFVRHLGKKATVVEMTDELAADAHFAVKVGIESELEKGVRCLAGATCTAISDQGVHLSWRSGAEEIVPADSVILAVGMRSTAGVARSMLDCAPDVIPVGDCIRPGTIQQASRTAYYTALDI
jgi:2,4-dienoyl-CoA reductase-like NADH-dependent reductase (Old Yellow Enzyme family)/thioredoxin reductase